MRLLTRRRFFAGLFLSGGGVAADMALIEPSALRVSRYEVPIGRPAGAAPVSLLHLSDFHASDCVTLEQIERGVQLGLSMKPDLICLTGDFISWRWEAWEEYAKVLAPLVRQAPTFAVLGNHDGGRWAASSSKNGYEDTSLVRALLVQAGVQLLHNRSQTIEIGGWPLAMAGVGDVWARELDLDAAFRDVPARTSTILLSHNPDTKHHNFARPWQLMLCGHTHGGQCRIPLVGTPFAPVRDHRFVEGLHRWQERWIHITRGIGNLHGLRFNCRPEVSVLRLT